MKDIFVKIIELDKSLSERIFKLQSKNILLAKLVRLSTRIYGIVPFVIFSILTTNNISLAIILFTYIVIVNSLIVESLIKRIFKRERPKFLEKKLNSYSFPSTHSSTSTMALFHLVLSTFLYNLTPLIIVIAFTWWIFVILSRVVYGHHYLIDIIAGIVIGLILYLPLAVLIKV